MAILLVLGATLLLGWATKDLVTWTEAWLAPASAIAIAGVGALLVIRGLRVWRNLRFQPDPSGTCGCGHAHGPTASQLAGLNSTREAIAIVASIAMRPCTGALFLLLIALRVEIFAVGCLAVVTMSMGTAAFNLIITVSGVAARGLATLPLNGRAFHLFYGGLHIAGGAVITFVSLRLAQTYAISPIVLR